jgi:hypothetical protein
MLGAQLSVIMADRNIAAIGAAQRAGLTIDRAYAVVTGQADVTVMELAALAGAVGARLEFGVHPVTDATVSPSAAPKTIPAKRGSATRSTADQRHTVVASEAKQRG